MYIYLRRLYLSQDAHPPSSGVPLCALFCSAAGSSDKTLCVCVFFPPLFPKPVSLWKSSCLSLESPPGKLTPTYLKYPCLPPPPTLQTFTTSRQPSWVLYLLSHPLLSLPLSSYPSMFHRPSLCTLSPSPNKSIHFK